VTGGEWAPGAESNGVAEAGEQKLDLVQDFIDVVTSMCARIYGRRAASNRAKKALAAAQEEP
jgi:putative resolvase